MRTSLSRALFRKPLWFCCSGFLLAFSCFGQDLGYIGISGYTESSAPLIPPDTTLVLEAGAIGTSGPLCPVCTATAFSVSFPITSVNDSPVEEVIYSGGAVVVTSAGNTLVIDNVIEEIPYCKCAKSLIADITYNGAKTPGFLLATSFEGVASVNPEILLPVLSRKLLSA